MLNSLRIIKNISNPPQSIFPPNVWVTGMHSHYVKSNKESPLGYVNYSPQNFDFYASQAYIRAKKNRLASWAVTDYNFDPVRWAQQIYPDYDLLSATQAWEKNARVSADNHTEIRRFIALAGFEYGKSVNFLDLSSGEQEIYRDRKNYKGHIDTFGDIVIFNAPFIPPQQGKHDIMNTMNLSSIYDYIKQYSSAIGIFAHPAPFPDGKGNAFENFRFYEDVVEQMVGFEVWNGCLMVRNQRYFINEYIKALQNGWRTGVMYNQDNSWPNWGDTKYNDYSLGFTVVFDYSSESYLSQERLFKQLRKRKFYGSNSQELILGIITQDGLTMGDTIYLEKPIITLIQAIDSNLDTIRFFLGSVGESEIASEVRSYSSGEVWGVELKVPIDGQTLFFFIELRNSQNEILAHSSPIWIKKYGSQL